MPGRGDPAGGMRARGSGGINSVDGEGGTGGTGAAPPSPRRSRGTAPRVRASLSPS
ncbi:predicted protein [Streptomyces sp. SPB78]|nr:predicted protein [Streptomyces sp. SPB78]